MGEHMKRRKILAVFCLALALFAGCQRKSHGSKIIVSHITVTYENDGVTLRQEYSAPEAMRTILGVIRMLGDRGRADTDPEVLPGQSYRIVMTHTDGSKELFRTKENRFVRYGRGPWQQVKPEYLARLHTVLQNLPGDTDKPYTRAQLPRFLPGIYLGDADAVFHSFGQEE